MNDIYQYYILITTPIFQKNKLFLHSLSSWNFFHYNKYVTFTTKQKSMIKYN